MANAVEGSVPGSTEVLMVLYVYTHTFRAAADEDLASLGFKVNKVLGQYPWKQFARLSEQGEFSGRSVCLSVVLWALSSCWTAMLGAG
jgi:hypothetical protein